MFVANVIGKLPEDRHGPVQFFYFTFVHTNVHRSRVHACVIAANAVVPIESSGRDDRFRTAARRFPFDSARLGCLLFIFPTRSTQSEINNRAVIMNGTRASVSTTGPARGRPARDVSPAADVVTIDYYRRFYCIQTARLDDGRPIKVNACSSKSASAHVRFKYVHKEFTVYIYLLCLHTSMTCIETRIVTIRRAAVTAVVNDILIKKSIIPGARGHGHQ